MKNAFLIFSIFFASLQGQASCPEFDISGTWFDVHDRQFHIIQEDCNLLYLVDMMSRPETRIIWVLSTRENGWSGSVVTPNYVVESARDFKEARDNESALREAIVLGNRKDDIVQLKASIKGITLAPKLENLSIPALENADVTLEGTLTANRVGNRIESLDYKVTRAEVGTTNPTQVEQATFGTINKVVNSSGILSKLNANLMRTRRAYRQLSLVDRRQSERGFQRDNFLMNVSDRISACYKIAQYQNQFIQRITAKNFDRSKANQAQSRLIGYYLNYNHKFNSIECGTTKNVPLLTPEAIGTEAKTMLASLGDILSEGIMSNERSYVNKVMIPELKTLGDLLPGRSIYGVNADKN